ncbi:MliC family protein [Salinisphaera orenii]|uniref:MliC family protein n=1 Tax=Salinisphaera orenii TaxID=856731 RepID=UPI000DBE521A
MSKHKCLITVAAFATAAIGAGCAPNTPPQDNDDANAGHSVARVTYACDHSNDREVRYPNDHTAVIPYKGSQHTLTLTRSADGARYTNDDIVWWNKGSGSNASASLFHTSNGNGNGDKIATCHQTQTSRTAPKEHD